MVGNPETSREFKNSMGKWYVQPGIQQVQNPKNCTNNVALIVWVVSLNGAKIHHSESQAIFLKFEIKFEYTLDTMASSSMLHAKIANYFQAAELNLGKCLWNTYHLQWPIADQ